LIFELEKWADFLAENDEELWLSFNNLGGEESFEEAGLSVFEFEKRLLNFAFFLRRLIEEADSCVASGAVGGNFNDLRTAPEEIVDFGKSQLSLPGSIGPKFQLNQSYNLTVQELCHQIIHHRLLNLNWPTPNGNPGFFVSSDRTSATKIFFIGLDKLSDCVVRLTTIIAKNEGAP